MHVQHGCDCGRAARRPRRVVRPRRRASREGSSNRSSMMRRSRSTSDAGVVAMKAANKGDAISPAGAAGPRRAAAERNPLQHLDARVRTQSRAAAVSPGAERIRQFVKRNPGERLHRAPAPHHAARRSGMRISRSRRGRSSGRRRDDMASSTGTGWTSDCSTCTAAYTVERTGRLPKRRVEIARSTDGGVRPLGIASLRRGARSVQRGGGGADPEPDLRIGVLRIQLRPLGLR